MTVVSFVLMLRLAGTLQGEAGVFGYNGMKAVADTMLARKATCVPVCPNSWDIVLGAYNGYAKPGPEALEIARGMLENPWVPGPYVYCYSNEDRIRQGWHRGDKVIEGPGGLELHLAKDWPGG